MFPPSCAGRWGCFCVRLKHLKWLRWLSRGEGKTRLHLHRVTTAVLFCQKRTDRPQVLARCARCRHHLPARRVPSGDQAMPFTHPWQQYIQRGLSVAAFLLILTGVNFILMGGGHCFSVSGRSISPRPAKALRRGSLPTHRWPNGLPDRCAKVRQVRRRARR